MTRHRIRRITAALLVVAATAAAGVLLYGKYLGPKTITAYFTTAIGIYAGDEVRIAGVKVGDITSIDAEGPRVKLVLHVQRSVRVPADARAVIVAQNLISARYVQLAPSYRTHGPVMADHAEIPIERTAVPVEWDEVKTQLTRLATELGPKSDESQTSISQFVDSTAEAMRGNGEKLRQTLAQLSGVGRILANGSGNLVDTIKNLQHFVSALRDSKTQMVEFQGRLATLSSVLDGSRSDLDGTLTNVAEVVGDVQRFIHGTRDQTAEQVTRLAAVTQNIVEHQKDLEQVLHVAPTGIANTYNFFDPRDGGINGVFALSNFADPAKLFCSSIGAVDNVTSTETSKLCAEYFGPTLHATNFNNFPIPINPYLGGVPPPELLRYTDPALAPGGSGGAPRPPETPPAVSAYSGLPGDIQPLPATQGLPGLLLPPGVVSPNPSIPPPPRLDGSPPR